MLTELERDVLQIILSNDLLLATVKKVFDHVIADRMPDVEITDDNLLLGERYRAYEQAKKLLAGGFQELESFRVRSPSTGKVNRGR